MENVRLYLDVLSLHDRPVFFMSGPQWLTAHKVFVLLSLDIDSLFVQLQDIGVKISLSGRMARVKYFNDDILNILERKT